MDLVLVKMENEQNYLFQAPSYCFLHEGELVMCETKAGEKLGTVVAIKSYESEDHDFYQFITKMNGVTTPLAKIKGKFQEFDYDKES